jgi:hypothetical protein
MSKTNGLEQLFGTIINKIPDLCHPPAMRLEGEDDFFNCTKHLKLEPFRTQEVFERCVTPTLDDLRHDAVTSPTGDYIKPKTCPHDTRTTAPTKSRRTDKARYPFANPIPECMLSNGEDNFSELILSHDIEWRMLTPIRPPNEYEELYVDKLIKLARKHHKLARTFGLVESDAAYDHYKQQQQQGHDGSFAVSPMSTFKHTRHGSGSPATAQLRRCERGQDGRTLSSSVSLGIKLKGRFHSRSNASITAAQTAKMINPSIPILTFTAEDEVVVDDDGE